jgi:hypothetical protein
MARTVAISLSLSTAFAVGLILALAVGASAAGVSVRDGAPICTPELLAANAPCVIPDGYDYGPCTPALMQANLPCDTPGASSATTTDVTAPGTTPTATTTVPTTPVNPLHNCVLYSDPSVEGKSCPLVKLAAFPSIVKKGTKITFHGSVFDSSKSFIYDIEIHVGNQPIGGKSVTDNGNAISHKARVYPTLTWKAKKGAYDVCAAAEDLKSTSVAFDCGLLTVN